MAALSEAAAASVLAAFRAAPDLPPRLRGFGLPPGAGTTLAPEASL